MDGLVVLDHCYTVIHLDEVPPPEDVFPAVLAELHLHIVCET